MTATTVASSDTSRAVAPPRVGGADALPRLLTEGYEFVTRGCRATGSDVFTTRLGGMPVICMQGVAAAELFYDRDLFHRQGALPRPVRSILFGRGGIQGLDGAQHQHRRALLRDQLPAEAVQRLAAAFGGALRARLPAWEQRHEVDLHAETARVLTSIVHQFCGVPLDGVDRRRRAADLQAMVTGAARIGPGRHRGRVARRRVERDLVGLVEHVRSGTVSPRPDTPLAALASHRDPEGNLLESRIVAVELLNLMRPTVAVNWFVSLAAVALHRNPQVVEDLRADHSLRRPVVQEVRRHMPFFPLIAACTRGAFEWQGWHFQADQRVLLDVYGTNHDPRSWRHPARFDPRRFVDRDVGEFELVAQGGGDAVAGHRCIGEQLAIHLLGEAVDVLAVDTTWQLAGDPVLPRGRMPTLPRDGVRLRRVQRRQD